MTASFLTQLEVAHYAPRLERAGYRVVRRRITEGKWILETRTIGRPVGKAETLRSVSACERALLDAEPVRAR